MPEEANGSAEVEMVHVNPQRAKQLQENVQSIIERVGKANKAGRNIRIICVSKLKPANDILALHQPPTSQLHFGENYAQEIQAKAALLPRTIRWHMIGGLQTNKCKPLAESVSNLWCVSSVDSAKKADALEKGRTAASQKHESGKGGQALPPLRVQVQVNTSGESEKSGVEPGEAAELCRHIREKCPHLHLAGLMTIGAIARSQASENENEDFITLRETRDKAIEELRIDKADLELSMGMSADFEEAIVQGSDEVRIGSTIFGDRPAKADAKVKEDAEEGG